MLATPNPRSKNLIRDNLNVALALADALVEIPNGKLTGGQVDAVIDFAVGLVSSAGLIRNQG